MISLSSLISTFFLGSVEIFENENISVMAAMDRSGMREWEEECKTPRHIENQIPAMLMCPPPPRKKPVGAGKRREPPKDGYFQPPDLDSLFAIPARKEAFA